MKRIKKIKPKRVVLPELIGSSPGFDLRGKQDMQREQVIESSFLYGGNAVFISSLYEAYLKNGQSVSKEWQQYFASLNDGTPHQNSSFLFAEDVVSKGVIPIFFQDSSLDQATVDSVRALMLIRSYQVRGHLIANLDPLGLEKRHYYPELDPATYGFGEKDFGRPIFMDGMLGYKTATLQQILQKLQATYCSTVGVEFMHIQDSEQRIWVQERVENRQHSQLSRQDRQKILQDLIHAENFEKFLQVKYPGAKRFGLEGAESLIPALEFILAQAAERGVKEVIFGAAHRGRLAILANILHKSMRSIFAEFHGIEHDLEVFPGSGDVKYHLGASLDRQFEGHKVHLSLTHNPSHLEAVNPIVLGKIRAKQRLRQDHDHSQVIGILLHGDAAFVGQGLVVETLELSGLQGYHTGGTLHIIINNQIGFTTNPPHSRSSPYCSDIAKAIQAPIFHVNGDDPEAVVWVTQLAADFRRQFSRDAVVDMVCYRRHGHNEGDDPVFTQPLMYKTIATHPTTKEIYTKQLLDSETISMGEVEELTHNFDQYLHAEFDAVPNYKIQPDWLEGEWKDIKTINNPLETYDNPDLIGHTAVDIDRLQHIGQMVLRVPEGFHLHHRIAKQFESRTHILESDKRVDWAMAESLSLGSLLVEGTAVRFSGQDSGRGTFSQRHAVLVDQETEDKYVPLNHVQADQAFFEVIDSPLSEASVLGFEYGYSTADPKSLVIWEAQFGDFANGAQLIIDEFVASGETKWLRLSGLVMLLPHGYEGQGPDHTSARLERFLQLCAETNLEVVNCSTPANYFHALRRQVRRSIRKPLIVMTPKSLLRNHFVVSTLADMGPNTGFQLVINDDTVDPNQIRRLILCSGKVYYDLYQEREKRQLMDIALVRVEQFYPFPRQALIDALAAYHQNAEVIWCQEEPINMGAWTFMDRRLESVLEASQLRQKRPKCIGRRPAAAAATGVGGRHIREQEQLINEVLTIP